MCGICGVYDEQRTAFPHLIRPMLDSMIHRGPDDEGIYQDEDVILGMRRLSIIDLDGGQQPIYNEDGSVALVFNGEIYNYRLVRANLEKKGHRFNTNSDTEVIVHLYEEYGVDCVLHLRGMFAFALWDTNTRNLLVARDHLGIKPVYYTTQGNRLIFASEIKTLLQHPAVEARLNLKALSDFLSLRYVPAPHTLFEDIMVLPPGHRIIHNGEDVRIESYWDVVFSEPSDTTRLSEQEYLIQLETMLRESVEMRLMSDVPFGAFLSGGVDSSTVVALMSQMLNTPVKTFSVGFRGEGAEDYSELPYARMVAEYYETDHYEVIVTPQDFIAHTEKIAWHLDQPLADYAEIAYYMVSELASRHVKMVLTGEGGDELFAGYGRYAGERYASVVQLTPQPLMSLALTVSKQFPRMRRPKAALFALAQADEATRHINWLPNFNSERKQALLTDEVSAALNGHATRDAFAAMLARSGSDDFLNRMLYTDTKLWLPDYLLSRGDKLTMSVSVEGRVPLLDYKLVEFAAKLPPDLKMNGGQRKYLLKQISRRLLPADIIDRKKKGFPVPVPIWLRREANPMMHDLLSSETIKRRGLFNADYVEMLINEHESGFANHATMLYGLMNLELWQSLFIDQQASCAPVAQTESVESVQ
ncbi:MAG: asparagine synthase (glutamine-hydrolyzing) [Chloroflexi bacterium]|nr:MAG: asparagine synthase (glutamine-hydrolyzing) [Chloroflexota bacterium]